MVGAKGVIVEAGSKVIPQLDIAIGAKNMVGAKEVRVEAGSKVIPQLYRYSHRQQRAHSNIAMQLLNDFVLCQQKKMYLSQLDGSKALQSKSDDVKTEVF